MLRVLKPLPITDAMLLAHSEPEADYAAWASGTTYAASTPAALVRVIKGHKVWQSAQGSNTNHDPELDDGTWWVEVAPTNRWAMFDGAVSTATQGASNTIEVTLQASADFVDAVALAAVVGGQARVRAVYAGQVVYDQTREINAGTAPNWWDWLFGERDASGDLLFADIPPYLGAQITITISGGATAACGVLALGRVYDIGIVETGGDAGITDYSRKETDVFGNTELVRRANAKRMSLPVVLTGQQLRPVHALLSSLTATPAFWVGDTDTDTFGPLAVWGWFRDFRQVIAWRDLVRMNVEVEGLT